MLRGLFLAALIGVFSMDAGVGEAAVLEGAKTAGEAAAAEGALTGAAGSGAGSALAGLAPSSVGAVGAEAAGLVGASEAAGVGAGALSGLGSAELGGLTGVAGSGAGSALSQTASSSVGGFEPIAQGAIPTLESTSALSGLGSAELGSGLSLSQGLKYANEARSAYNFAKDPSLQNGLSLGLNTANLASPGAFSSPAETPLGVGAEGIPGTPDPLTGGGSSAFSPNTFTGTPTTGYTPPDLTGALKASPVEPGMLDKILGAAKANPLQAANTGLGALSIAKQLGAGSAAQNQYNKAAGPTAGVSNQLLQQFQTGQISGADAFQITQFAQQQKAKIDQYYQKAGLSNSSMHQQALQQVDQQAEQMRQQAVQNLLKNGLSAAGVSNPLIAQGITAGVNADAASMKAMQDFIAQLAKMNTPQASQTGSPTTPPPGP